MSADSYEVNNQQTQEATEMSPFERFKQQLDEFDYVDPEVEQFISDYEHAATEAGKTLRQRQRQEYAARLIDRDEAERNHIEWLHGNG